MYLIINLVFLTSFQFINLSNLALWVNNRRKWITVIFLNLCDNFLYYMICFWLLPLFISFSLSCLHISDTHPIPLLTLWIYSTLCTSNQNLFLTIPFFFFFLSLLLPNYLSTKNKQSNTILIYSIISTNSTLSLYLSDLYNKRERVIHTVTESHKAKETKKKNTTGTDSIHNHQLSSSLISKNTNTTSPQAQIVRF